MMGKFRKKPIEVEAFRVVDGVSFPGWAKDVVVKDGLVQIATLEGVMRANPGDWIIQGVTGELYPCKSDIFEATYDLVEDTG